MSSIKDWSSFPFLKGYFLYPPIILSSSIVDGSLFLSFSSCILDIIYKLII